MSKRVGSIETIGMQSERDFSQAVYDYARMVGWKAVRWPTWRPTGTTPGVPDMLMVRPPRLVFIELKAKRGKLSEAQAEWLQALAESGAEAYCWRPADWDEIEKVLR